MTSESPIDTSASPVMATSFDDVADELYSHPPHRFAELRTASAEQARTAGAVDVAARIEGLPVPSAAAWLSNQLVRYFRDQVLVLLDLGRALQVATGDLDTGTVEPDALRRLDERRRDVYNELHRLASWLALEDRVPVGKPALRGLGDTLHSAMCSERMAQQMLAGRLVRSLPRISWPGLTQDSFPDELARRRALRAARGVEPRSSRYATDDDDDDDDDEDDGPLATVTALSTRAR